MSWFHIMGSTIGAAIGIAAATIGTVPVMPGETAAGNPETGAIMAGIVGAMAPAVVTGPGVAAAIMPTPDGIASGP